MDSGTYPINSGQSGFATTHNPVSGDLLYTFGGSGLIDLTLYKNGAIEIQLTNYSFGTLNAGGTTASPSDVLVLIINDSV